LSGCPAAASGRDEGPQPDSGQDYEDEETGEAYRGRDSARTECIDCGGPEGAGDRAAKPIEHGRSDALTGKVEEEQERVEAHGHPDRAERHDKGKNGCRRESNEPGRPRDREPPPGRIEGGHVPRFEHLDLRHHALPEERGRHKVGQALERANHLPSFSQFGATFLTVLDVREEWGDAESGFAVQELVDFVW